MGYEHGLLVDNYSRIAYPQGNKSCMVSCSLLRSGGEQEMPRKNRSAMGHVRRTNKSGQMAAKKCKWYFIIRLVPGRKLGSWFTPMGGTDVYRIWGKGRFEDKGDVMILRIPSRGIVQPIPKAAIRFARAHQP